MSKIEKFVIGKGTTRKIKGTENDFNRKYLELTIRLPEQFTEEDIQEALIHAEYILDNWLSQEPTPQIPQIPQLDIAEINSLPWKTRKKEPAKLGTWAWVFGPESAKGVEQGAETLANALLHTEGHKFVLGDMEYSLSDNKAFIQRKPLKQKSAK